MRNAAKREEGLPLLDLTNSNPTVFPDYPHEQLAEAYNSVCDFTYDADPLGSLSARSAVTQYYREHGCEVSPEQVLLTASTSEAYAMLFKVLCDPGDEILVPAPSYPLFDYLAALECVRPVAYRLGYDGSWFFDCDHIRDAITERTRAIVLVTPNNPTGSAIRRAEALRLIAFSRDHGIPLIVDEVFLDYPVGAAAPLVSFTAFSQTLSFSLSGLSKCAGMPQMKLGWIVVNGPPGEQNTAIERLELVADTFLSVATPVQKALPALFMVGRSIRTSIKARLAENYSAAAERLRGSPAHLLHTDGGWSSVIQLPSIMAEEEWVDKLLDEFHCIAHPGYFFDLQGICCVVVSLLTEQAEFLRGMALIRKLVTQYAG